jgi:carbamoyltransferase
MDYFDFAVGSTMTNKKFNRLFGAAPRQGESDITQREMDLARSIQVVTEEIVLNIVNHLATLTDSKNLCLAGGVALNCVANGRILREGAFDNIWIQPAAGDAGGSLGAALVAWHHYYAGEKYYPEQVNTESITTVASEALPSVTLPSKVSPTVLPADLMRGSYLGPSFSLAQITQVLNQRQLPHTLLCETDLHQQVAKLLDEGNVIGWFQGSMEFGPRALGNRSILGDARNQAMQSVMNLKIKYRESFRPFAPIVLAEDVSDYFQHNTTSPYMLIVAEINDSLKLPVSESLQGIEKLKQARSTLPAITHVDNTARLQTVHKQTNPKLHQLLSTFKALTGSSVLIKTSFNVRGEPPVCSPDEAINCFLATEMDYLVMDNVVIAKSQQSEEAILDAKNNHFELD